MLTLSWVSVIFGWYNVIPFTVSMSHVPCVLSLLPWCLYPSVWIWLVRSVSFCAPAVLYPLTLLACLALTVLLRG
ncbi:hypothetical protein EV421DRAFT_1007575 [Armillaria borealis]|uniref:Uncharacterized protein n=1 Tax=Armillaria borealis TaxID=47425 RepID=A0AA39J7X2_9AGAR|nr:hypothetical protein EV421DRAFT_1007575 [Armillaria borealis]